MKTITYFYRGGVERGTGSGYEWRNGYSETREGAVLYPWMTRRECQADARKQGAKAKFENPKPELCPTCNVDRKETIAGKAWRCLNCGSEWNKTLTPSEKQLGQTLAEEQGA